jgi:hypothetical protein
MPGDEYKGYEIDVKPMEAGPRRWRITGVARLVAGAFKSERPLSDERIFSTEREARAAGVTLARTWIDNRINRIKDHPLSGREAAERQISLLEKTHSLWEALHHLRQEIEADVDRRRQKGKPVTDRPYDLGKLARYVRILEDGVRKGMDDAKKYHAGGEGGKFGDAWLKKMEDRFREGTE